MTVALQERTAAQGESILQQDRPEFHAPTAPREQRKRAPISIKALPNIYGLREFTAAAMVFALNSNTVEASDPQRWATTQAASEGISEFGFAVRATEPWIEMESYRGLKPGWDGPKSFAPSSGTIDDAQALLEALPFGFRLPEATISADGQVGWFWRTNDSYIDIAFLGDHRIAYYARAKGRQIRNSVTFIGHSIPQELQEIISLI